MLCPKISLWISIQEAYYTRETASKYKWLMYQELSENNQEEYIIKQKKN